MTLQADQLKLVHYPDPVLRAPTCPIEKVTDEVRRVALRMLEIMHEAPGVGLAAPQVGLSWRMFVTNTGGESGVDQVFINPVLTHPGRVVTEYEEGCLSLPGVTVPIRRPKGIAINAIDLDGNPFSLVSEELAARVWQHEYDHLECTLIIDRMAEIDKIANKKILRDLEDAYRGQ
jgi:peptide deformylase